MHHTGICLFCILGLLAMTASGQKKPDFSGKWQANAERSQLRSGKASAVSLSIDQKGTSVHIVKTMRAESGKESIVEFTCTTDGKDCETKGIKVSLWYDGVSLVEMDVSDGLIAKTSMTLGDNAKTIGATVTYISPKAEDDQIVLDKT